MGVLQLFITRKCTKPPARLPGDSKSNSTDKKTASEEEEADESGKKTSGTSKRNDNSPPEAECLEKIPPGSDWNKFHYEPGRYLDMNTGDDRYCWPADRLYLDWQRCDLRNFNIAAVNTAFMNSTALSLKNAIFYALNRANVPSQYTTKPENMELLLERNGELVYLTDDDSSDWEGDSEIIGGTDKSKELLVFKDQDIVRVPDGDWRIIIRDLRREEIRKKPPSTKKTTFEHESDEDYHEPYSHQNVAASSSSDSDSSGSGNSDLDDSEIPHEKSPRRKTHKKPAPKTHKKPASPTQDPSRPDRSTPTRMPEWTQNMRNARPPLEDGQPIPADLNKAEKIQVMVNIDHAHSTGHSRQGVAEKKFPDCIIDEPKFPESTADKRFFRRNTVGLSCTVDRFRQYIALRDGPLILKVGATAYFKRENDEYYSDFSDDDIEEAEDECTLNNVI